MLALGKDVGAYLCVYTGMFYDRFGSRSTLVTGVRTCLTAICRLVTPRRRAC